MILTRVRVEGYQALRNPVELTDLGVGLHVLHGPNETGKSTLIAAIARAFFDRYATMDQEMRLLRPWGTELGPRILVEFETTGKKFRLEKKFLDEESSALSEWSGSRFERVADSTKADDRVRELMSATATKVGASGLKNWGLARLLWMTQHSSRLDPPELDSATRQRLMGVLGSAVLSSTEQTLLARLDQTYETYYTAAKQSEKKGSPLAEARERLARAEELLAHWKSRWEEATHVNETASGAETRLNQVSTERKSLEQSIRELRARSEKELQAESRIRLKQQEFLVLQGQWMSLSERQAELKSLQTSIAAKQLEAAESEPRLAACVSRFAQCEIELTQAADALKNLASAAEAISKQIAEASALNELQALSSQATDLSRLLDSASAIERERQTKADLYLSKKRPKEAELDEARAWERDIHALERRIEDQGIEVRFTPEKEGLSVQWSDGLLESLPAGVPAIFRSTDSGELIIPGVGRIRVRSGAAQSITQDTRQLQKRLDELKSSLRAKLATYSLTTVEELNTLRRETAEIETQGQALRSALSSALGGRFQTLIALQSELERVQKILSAKLMQAGLNEAELANRISTVQGNPASDALLAQLPAHLKELRANQFQAEKLKEQRDTELRGLGREREALQSRLDSARQAIALLENQRTVKISAAGGVEFLEKDLARVFGEKTSVQAEVELLQKQLPPEAERASIRIAASEKRLEEATQQERLANQERDRASATLQSAQLEGYYSKLAQAEEEHVLAAELLRKRLAKAQGAKLLRTLAHERRERMSDGLLTPVEASASQIFERIRGPGPAGLTSQTATELAFADGDPKGESKIQLEALSLGTREQIMLAMRLAFGELLAVRGEHPEPQLIVLDDPLVNADPERQKRALEILSQASQKLQILVLTARPEDYRSIERKEYDLAALKVTSH